MAFLDDCETIKDVQVQNLVFHYLLIALGRESIGRTVFHYLFQNYKGQNLLEIVKFLTIMISFLEIVTIVTILNIIAWNSDDFDDFDDFYIIA